MYQVTCIDNRTIDLLEIFRSKPEGSLIVGCCFAPRWYMIKEMSGWDTEIEMRKLLVDSEGHMLGTVCEWV